MVKNNIYWCRKHNICKNVLGDAMLTPSLSHADIALYDINQQRLRESELMLKTINKMPTIVGQKSEPIKIAKKL